MCCALSSNYDDHLRRYDGRVAYRLRIRRRCDIAPAAGISSRRRPVLFAAYYALYHTRHLHLPGLIAGEAKPALERAARKPQRAVTVMEIAGWERLSLLKWVP